MAWWFLILAGLLEVGWAIGLKSSLGFTRLWPSVATVVAMVLSMLLLGLAVRTIPIGTGYVIWTGIGAVGAATLGMVLFGEPATAARLFCLGLILAGIIGLKIAT
jgi:quaternary ammonium compound-resistance protein SugE